MKNLYFCITTAVLFTVANIAAQSVAYQFDRTFQPYEPLQNGIALTYEWEPWKGDNLYTLPIGFPFGFCGITFDTIDVSAASTLYFGGYQSGNNYCFAGFSKAITDLFWIIPGANESLSPVTFENTGSPGSRILKIQWANAGFMTGSTADFVHFQIWLHEATNAISVHLGPQHITSSSVYEGADHTGPVIGFFNESEAEHVCLFGDAQNPALGYPPFGFKGLEGTPAEGILFAFHPAINTITAHAGRRITVNHSPDDHTISVENAENITALLLTDCSGKVIQEIIPEQHNTIVQFHYQSRSAGLYFLVIRFRDHPPLTKKLFLRNG